MLPATLDATGFPVYRQRRPMRRKVFRLCGFLLRVRPQRTPTHPHENGRFEIKTRAHRCLVVGLAAICLINVAHGNDAPSLRGPAYDPMTTGAVKCEARAAQHSASSACGALDTLCSGQDKSPWCKMLPILAFPVQGAAAALFLFVHFILTALLMGSIKSYTPIYSKIFRDQPMGIRIPIWLRGTYFWPRTREPVELAQCSLYTRILFRATRITGTGFFIFFWLLILTFVAGISIGILCRY